MKFSTATLCLLPLFTPAALAWRIRLYQHAYFQGSEVTYAGPGNPGSACFDVGDLNNEISSIKLWPQNPEATTWCCVRFYDSPGCVTKSGDWGSWRHCLGEINDLKNSGYNDDISSFKTECEWS
jgi:hypothetical protein